ncbi:hypothetical protein ABPG75_011351 [Micractinium tetrahymenae]
MASYSAQYDELWASPHNLDARRRLPKPSLEAQSKEPEAKLVPLSRVWALPKLNNWLGREPWSLFDIAVTGFIMGQHVLCLAAPFTFTWPAFWLFAVLFFAIGCLGIDVSFHRQLTHRSFSSPKLVEYLLAFLGTLGGEMDPIDWVRHHRYHHRNCDSPLDPHSTYEGFFWAHCGWLMHSKVRAGVAGAGRAHRRPWIVSDLVADPFYRLLHYTYPLLSTLQYVALYWLGGWPALIWGGAVRQVLMWHVTWLVNSACHIWGSRPYATPDLSTNCGWLALPTFGESWHNNHHAFPGSARHGLEWWQVDIAWWAIRALQALGLAWDIRLPTEAQKRAKLAAPANGTANEAEADGADGFTDGAVVGGAQVKHEAGAPAAAGASAKEE